MEDSTPSSFPLVFFVNGEKIVEPSPNPEWTLLYFLRYKLRLCGTKEACGEGGCGACTVLQQKINDVTGKIENNAINACLTPLCSVHGTAIITVEGIGSLKKGLHPVQERIAKSHGTQCGYCTPGFVMSMYALLRNNPAPTEHEMEDAFQGNLCRCTGYRPILQGYQTLCKKTNQQNIQNGGCCGGAKGGKCCMKSQPGSNDTKVEVADTLFDESEFKPYDPSQDLIFPPELQLNKEIRKQSLNFKGTNATWLKPANLAELLEIKQKHSEAKLVGGFTEVGIEVRFKQQNYPILVHVSDIKELNEIRLKDNRLEIGGAATLSNLKRFCEKLQTPNGSRGNGTMHKAVNEMLHWFAGQQIRNVATVAGNIATASPISDLNPILMACGSQINLRSLKGGKRSVPMDESFFLKYRTITMQPSEVLESIEVPLTKENEFVWAAKQARRREDDIAIVNTCMKLVINFDTLQIQDATFVFGGMAPTTKFARKTAKILIGKKWNEESLQEQASNELLHEMKLEKDVPGGMAAYRQVLAQSFLTKFFVAVSCWLVDRHHKLKSIPEALQSATMPITRGDTAGVQLYQIVPKSQKVADLVGRPLVHQSALKHATGEALYIGDEVPHVDQLYGFLVPSTIAHGKILSIDASAALALPGVVRFFCAKDLTPGQNICGYGVQDEEVFASEYVHSHGQTVGMILATDPFTAEKAAKMVTMKFEELPVILTIEDAIANESYHTTKKLVWGNVTQAFKTADHIMEGEVHIGGQEHFYMETQCCTVTPGEDQELDIQASCQGPDMVQTYLSKKLGIPSNRIRVSCRRMGGSFGGKESKILNIALPTAIAAVATGKSVRTMMTRWEDMVLTAGRNPFTFRYIAGFTKEGRILGVEAYLYCNAGYSLETSLGVTEKCIMAVDAAYTIPNWNVKAFICKTNLPSNTAFRGYGGPQANIFMENLMDAVGEKLGIDPIEIRKMHLKRDNGDMSLLGFPVTDCTVRRCWDECVTNSRYEERRKLVEQFNANNRWKKRGIAVMPMKHPVGFKKNVMNQAGALVMIYTDGSVGLTHGGTEMGQGLVTKMIQVASRELGGVPAEKIYFKEMSTDKVPNAIPACGSFSSDMNGMAVKDACEQLRKRLEPFKEKNPGGKWEDWVMAAYMARTNLSAVGFYEVDLSYDFDCPEDKSRMPYLYMVYGVAVSEVEVDCLTGDHSVLRTDIVIDAGESLNPAVDVGQIEGAFMQGYGLFTMEELLYSPKGLLLTKGPGMYKIPAMGDIPRVFNVSLLRGGPPTKAVYSSKGVGEPPLFLAASVYFAIKEAIKAARRDNGQSTMFRLDCPATAEKIRLAINDDTVQKVRKEIEGSNKGKGSVWAVTV